MEEAFDLSSDRIVNECCQKMLYLKKKPAKFKLVYSFPLQFFRQCFDYFMRDLWQLYFPLIAKLYIYKGHRNEMFINTLYRYVMWNTPLPTENTISSTKGSEKRLTGIFEVPQCI